MFKKFTKKEKRLRVNYQIKAYKVRLIDENGKQLGVVTLREALDMAREKGLDLVEVSPNIFPPVCKILSWGKYLYEQKKQKKKPKNVETKEVRLTAKIDEHDFEVKLKQAVKFLQKRQKVKTFLFLKGREIVHKEVASKVLENFKEAIKDYGEPEQELKMQGRTLSIVFIPKK